MKDPRKAVVAPARSVGVSFGLEESRRFRRHGQIQSRVASVQGCTAQRNLTVHEIPRGGQRLDGKRNLGRGGTRRSATRGEDVRLRYRRLCITSISSPYSPPVIAGFVFRFLPRFAVRIAFSSPATWRFGVPPFIRTRGGSADPPLSLQTRGFREHLDRTPGLAPEVLFSSRNRAYLLDAKLGCLLTTIVACISEGRTGILGGSATTSLTQSLFPSRK